MRLLPRSRHKFIVGTSAMACGAIVPVAAATAADVSAPVVRRDIDALSAAELATYAHAVGLLLRDPRSNTAAVPLHPALRQTAPSGQRAGGSSWPPENLKRIERMLRAADPARTAAVTIPYWNFTRPPSGRVWPAAFEAAESPLFAIGNYRGEATLYPAMWSYHAYIELLWQDWVGATARSRRVPSSMFG